MPLRGLRVRFLSLNARPLPSVDANRGRPRSRSNTFCEERWLGMWARKEPYEIPEFVKEQLTNGTAAIETVQREVLH